MTREAAEEMARGWLLDKPHYNPPDRHTLTDLILSVHEAGVREGFNQRATGRTEKVEK